MGGVGLAAYLRRYTPDNPMHKRLLIVLLCCAVLVIARLFGLMGNWSTQ
jgi:hypothetical protein